MSNLPEYNNTPSITHPYAITPKPIKSKSTSSSLSRVKKPTPSLRKLKKFKKKNTYSTLDRFLVPMSEEHSIPSPTAPPHSSTCLPKKTRWQRRKWKIHNCKEKKTQCDPIITFRHCNVRGLLSSHNFQEVHSVITRFKYKTNTDVFSINEVNLDTSKPKLKYRIDTIIKRQDKYCKISHGIMKHEQSLSDYKPGGTMVGVFGQWASRFCNKGFDDQGRWSWISLHGKRGKKVLVLSVYRVSQDHPSQVSQGSAYQQQFRHQQKTKKAPNPKKECLVDLLEFISQWNKHHHSSSIIVMLDSNEDVKDNGQFQDFIHKTQLVDVVKVKNPIHAATRPTYNRSKNRLDYILVSQDLLSSIVQAGHHDFHELIQSTDHRGVYMSIKTEALFDSAEIDPTHLAHRRLQLHRRDVVNSYIAYLTEIYNNNKFWERTVDIVFKLKPPHNQETHHQLIKSFDNLDKERQQYMLAAERKSGIAPKTDMYEWSPLLEKVGRTYIYWKARRHLEKLDLRIPSSLLEIQHELNILSTCNLGTYITAKLQMAKKELKKVQKKASAHRDKYLHELADHYASIRDSTKERELRQIIRNERI